jgi:hypothetical protein
MSQIQGYINIIVRAQRVTLSFVDLLDMFWPYIEFQMFLLPYQKCLAMQVGFCIIL